MTELEFKSLAQQGYNRIPLIAEAFADLETPLSLYLKLARQRRPQAQLPARIGGRRRALRPLLVHRPAGAHAAARQRLSHRGRHRRRGGRDARGQSARLHRRRTSSASRSRCGPGCRASAAAWPATSATTRCATSSRKLAKTWKDGGIDTPDILLLQCEELAVIDNLSGRLYLIVYADPTAARGVVSRASGGSRELTDKLDVQRHRAAGQARRRRMPVEREFDKDDYLAAVLAPRSTSPPAT